MADEEASNPAEEVAPDNIEETAPDEIAATEDEAGDAEDPDTGDDGDGEGAEAEVEEVELNFGGDKIKVPKGAIPDEIVAKIGDFSKNLEAGYTKKFQTLAEQRQSVEAREQAVEKLQSLSDASLEKYSRGIAVRQELERLQKIDTRALWQSNPDQARRVSDDISRMNAEFQAIVNDVAKTESELSATQKAEQARLMEEGKREVERRIPGFAEKHLSAVTEYVVSKGLPKEEVANYGGNPLFTEMAWKAKQFDDLQAKATAATKPRPAAAQPVAPSGGKGGKATKSLADMSMEEYAEHMNKRERARR